NWSASRRFRSTLVHFDPESRHFVKTNSRGPHARENTAGSGVERLALQIFALGRTLHFPICIGGKNPRCSPETGLTETSAEPAKFRRTVSPDCSPRVAVRSALSANLAAFTTVPPSPLASSRRPLRALGRYGTAQMHGCLRFAF